MRISQTKYIRDMLERFGMQDVKPAATPLEVNAKLKRLETEVKEMKDIPYRSAVGSLMYAMVGTRPDIAAAVGVVSRHLERPGLEHWQAVKRIFRYLKGSLDMAIEYGCSKSRRLQLSGYCDADWGGDMTDRRSTTGYVFMMAGGAVSWNSRKQPTVALSSTEAEYMALSGAVQEAIWLRQLLRDLGYAQQGATPIYEDNQGCINLANNPVSHSRTKHIDIRHHFVRERLESGDIGLQYCQTGDMGADLLTKGIATVQFRKLRAILGIRSHLSGSVEG